MLLKDIQITPQGTVPDDIDPSAPSIRTVNGLSQSDARRSRPARRSSCASPTSAPIIYYQIKLDGHKFYELARDGNRRIQLVEHG